MLQTFSKSNFRSISDPNPSSTRQALKFKTAIPDANFLMLTNLVLLDAGGAIAIGTEFADSFPKV